MDEEKSSIESLYAGLQSVIESSFPRSCPCCGKEFATVREFLKETRAIQKSTGLMATEEEDGMVIIELYRNCSCGSTLMEEFCDRRDDSTAGVDKRKQFDQLIKLLLEKGIEENLAKTELRKIFHGGTSQLIFRLLKPHIATIKSELSRKRT